MNPSTVIIPNNRTIVEPQTWVLPPLYRGDSERVRNASEILGSYSWVKVPGYQRVNSWDELEYLRRFTQDDARSLGHSRETWDGGYIRSWGIDSANLRPGDRIGHQTIVMILNAYGVVRCDCGQLDRIRPLDRFAGVAPPLGCSRECSMTPCNGWLDSCRCWGCTGLRWHEANRVEVPEHIAAMLSERRQDARQSAVRLVA